MNTQRHALCCNVAWQADDIVLLTLTGIETPSQQRRLRIEYSLTHDPMADPYWNRPWFLGAARYAFNPSNWRQAALWQRRQALSAATLQQLHERTFYAKHSSNLPSGITLSLVHTVQDLHLRVIAPSLTRGLQCIHVASSSQPDWEHELVLTMLLSTQACI